MKTKLPVTGALLVGGESRRMGEDKAFLSAGGKTLIERGLEVLADVCQEVVISCRIPELYHIYGYPVIVDKVIGKGPLGGIYSVLAEARHDLVFVMACDMPLADGDGIRFLYEKVADFDAVVPKTGDKFHPLYALYHRRILSKVEHNLHQEKLKIIQVLNECRIKGVEIDDISDREGSLNIRAENLMNVNTPEDYKEMMRILNKQ